MKMVLRIVLVLVVLIHVNTYGAFSFDFHVYQSPPLGRNVNIAWLLVRSGGGSSAGTANGTVAIPGNGSLSSSLVTSFCNGDGCANFGNPNYILRGPEGIQIGTYAGSQSTVQVNLPWPSYDFAMPLTNLSFVPVIGWWRFQGVKVHEQTIYPGSSATHTVKVLRGEAFSAQWGVNQKSYDWTYTDGGDLVLTNLSSGQTNDFTGILDFFGVTNVHGGGSGFNQIINVNNYTGPSNLASINWQHTPASNDLAREVTLQGGFAIQHEELRRANVMLDRIRAGIQAPIVNVSNVTISGATGLATEAMQQAILDGINANGDVFVSVTNVSTNTFGMTNFATESTLAGMSNVLSGMASNLSRLQDTNDFAGMTNRFTQWFLSWDADFIEGMMSPFTTTWNGIIAAIQGNFLALEDGDLESIDQMTLAVPTGGGGSITWNFDPLSNFGVGSIFTLARKLFAYLLCIAYLVMMVKDLQKVADTLGSAQQGTFANVSAIVMGTGGSAPIAPIIIPLTAGLLLVAWGVFLAAIGLAVAGFLGADVWSLLSNPLQATSGAVATGVRLARHFFPFGVFLGLTVAFCVWRLALSSACAVFAMFVRLVFGS